MKHRTLLDVFVAFGLLFGGLAQAQDRAPVRMVVPFGAGTTTDTVGRIVGEALGKNLQQPVIVENRAGAGGSTGTDLVAKATPDGRTLVMGTVGTHAINAALFSKLPYDPLRDFAPVAFVGTAAGAALAQPDVMARLRDQGIESRGLRAEEMLPFNKTELGKWAGLVKRSGAQVD
jgi:tripartite-type tricarboxylate transporter receptor subunit TctC